MIFKDAQAFVARKLEERRERRAARRAEQVRNPHQGRFWLLQIPACATICAAIVEVYWAFLFCIEATGAVDWNWETAIGSGVPPMGAWNFSFSAHLPVLIGLLAATAPIVMISMIWLPVQFAMRGSGRWRRGTMIGVGLLANILVIVSGTVVMNYNRQEQVREALVTEQSADAQRQMLVANVDDLRAELDTLMNHRSTYVATAASVGAVAYERDYVAQARSTNDPRLPLLERALGSARRADELRTQIREARQNVAAAQPAAASAANVQDTVGVGLNTFAQYVEVYRPPFIALICTLIGVFGAWWVVAMLEHMNPRDVLRSGWADEDHRIEDLRAEAPVDAKPMKPPREVVTDAETGEELIKVSPRPHWRKRKGQPNKMDVQPEIPPDEAGVKDGAQPGFPHGRTGLTVAGPLDVSALTGDGGVNSSPLSDALNAARPVSDGPHNTQEHENQNESDSSAPSDALIQDEPPPPNDAEALELAAVLADEAHQETTNNGEGDDRDPSEQSPADEAAGTPEIQAHAPSNEAQNYTETDSGDDTQQTEPPSDEPGHAPQTDPRRMIAAE